MDDHDAADLAKLELWLEGLTGKIVYVRRRGDKIIAVVGTATLSAATADEARENWRHVLQLYGWIE